MNARARLFLRYRVSRNFQGDTGGVSERTGWEGGLNVGGSHSGKFEFNFPSETKPRGVQRTRTNEIRRGRVLGNSGELSRFRCIVDKNGATASSYEKKDRVVGSRVVRRADYLTNRRDRIIQQR